MYSLYSDDEINLSNTPLPNRLVLDFDWSEESIGFLVRLILFYFFPGEIFLVCRFYLKLLLAFLKNCFFSVY